MISNSKIKKLFAYLVPHLGNKTKAELDVIYSEIEKLLGYDPAKAAKYRKDAKERDSVMETLMKISLAESADSKMIDKPVQRMKLSAVPKCLIQK